MCHLQEFYAKYRSYGFVILGLNTEDDKQIALDIMRENAVTFPNILDTSAAAKRVADHDYPNAGCPTNYIIDRDGTIVDAWVADYRRAFAALQKTGGELANAIRHEISDAAAKAKH
jgi:peroxiredoxin